MTLFSMEVTPFTDLGMDGNGAHEFRGSALLHRYDLATHTEIASPFSFSDTFNADGSFGFYIVPGWDISADGSHIAYQHMQVHRVREHISMGCNPHLTRRMPMVAERYGFSEARALSSLMAAQC